MTVPAWPVAGVVFALLWLLIRGVALAPRVLAGQFLLGLVAGLPTAFVFRRLYAARLDPGQFVAGVPYAVGYVASFGLEIVRANLDVAYRVLAPEPRIEPEVILLPLRVESAVAVTVIANSITLTPGTVTLDYDEDANALYVHAVDGRDPAAIAAPIRTWEGYALEIFDEPRSPDDPPPEIVVDGREPEARRERAESDGTDVASDPGRGNRPDGPADDGGENRE